MKNKIEFLELIKSNINKSSFHINVVEQYKTPRYAYTVGNFEKLNAEFIIAGNENYLYNEILEIFNSIIPMISEVKKLDDIYPIPKFGMFRLKEVDKSWKQKMMLGVYDYYKVEDFKAYQIIADPAHFTLDIPDMSIKWDSNREPIWKWLDDNIEWNLEIPEKSTAVTEVKVLYGAKITEVMRWEEDDWQAFTQDSENIRQEDMRVVPISTLIGIDKTLLPITKLNIGKGVWRGEDHENWTDWG